ncbi:MAG: C25 family cysteine peptidase [Caldilineaceae bacterium]
MFWQKGRHTFRIWLFMLALLISTLASSASAVAQVAPMLVTPAGQTGGASANLALTIDDSSGEIIVEMVTSEFAFEDGASAAGPCKKIVAPAYEQSSAPGEPQLPLYMGLMGAPPSGHVSVEIRSMESITLTGNINLCPAPRATAQHGDGDVTPFVEEPTVPDPHVYAQDALYPQQPAAIAELGFMRSQRLVRFALYPFQVNHATGQLVYHRVMRVAIRFSEGATQTSGESAVEDEAFERVMRGLLLNYAVARTWRGTPLSGQEVTAWTPPADAYRVLVAQTGIHRLTYDELAAAGFPVDQVDPAQIRMMYNGQEIAIRMTGHTGGAFGPDNAILFYAEAPHERFAPTNVYWLTRQPVQEGLNQTDAQVGRRMEEISNSRVAQAVPETVAVTQLHLEENSNYVSSLPMEPGYDHWYGRRITAVGAGQTGHQDIVADLGQVSAGAATARLQVALAGNVRGPHHLRIFINRTPIFEGNWVDRTYQTFETTFDHNLLQAGENTVRLQLVNDAPGQTVDMAYIDWVKLTYTRQLGAQDNHIDFTNRGPGNWKYSIAGFDGKEVEAYDVTDPTKVRVVLGALENGRFNFSDYQATPRHYIVSAGDNQLAPLRIEAANSMDLRTVSSSIDYIMIAHPDLVNAIRPLADYRARRGLNVLVVNLQDVYDQFNYGRASAQAIQDFLKYAYANWPAPAPRFALLVGDGNYDPLGYLDSSEPSLLPPYLAMVDPDLGETAADNRYATIVGDDLIPDLSIGRFPAKTAADVTAMVTKTLRYEQAPSDPNWNQSILFVADDLEGGGGAFQNFSDAIADGYIETSAGRLPLLPAEYTRTKLYLGAECEDGTPAVQCRQEIVNEVNKGLLFVSYVGHGAKQYWAEEQIFNQDALFQLNNEARLPIMLPMTCLEGFFHEAAANSDAFGEMIVRQPQSGAVASWSPTGFGLASGHDYLETGFFLGLFHQGLTTVGEATTFGKMHMIAHAPPTKYDDLLDTFVLFGDPALAVRSAGRAPVVDTQSQYLPIVIHD